MKILVSERISEHRFKTPEGYLVCQDAILARTGKQTYLMKEIFPDSGSDETVDIDRKPEQVFSDSTMASFNLKPITVEHPKENVSPENYKDLSVGFVTDIRRAKVDGQDVMIGNLMITDPDVIRDIENGVRTELSCGYDCDITKNDHPEQVNIRGNHIALCEQGRAGNARIIDSAASLANRWVRPIKTHDAQYCDELDDFARVLASSKNVKDLKKLRSKLLDVILNDNDKREQKRMLIDAINARIIELDDVSIKDDAEGYSKEYHRNLLAELVAQEEKIQEEIFNIQDEEENDAVKESIHALKLKLETIKKQEDIHRKALGL